MRAREERPRLRTAGGPLQALTHRSARRSSCGFGDSAPWSPFSAPCSVESKLVTVMPGVLVALLEHILHVLACLGERNVVQAQAGASPGGHVGLPGVICRQCGDLIVPELLDQVAEIEGAVADVDVG